MTLKQRDLAEIFTQAILKADRKGGWVNLGNSKSYSRFQESGLEIAASVAHCPCPWPHTSSYTAKISEGDQLVFSADYACFYTEIGYYPLVRPTAFNVKTYQSGSWEEQILKDPIIITRK